MNTDIETQRQDINSERSIAKPSTGCPICDVEGLAICPHRKSGGDSEEAENDSKSENHSIPSLKPSSTFLILSLLHPDELDKKLRPKALNDELNNASQQTIFNLDSQSGMLQLQPKPGLSGDYFAMLVDEIADKFDDFKHWLRYSDLDFSKVTMHLTPNDLTINIPSPSDFSNFISELRDANLMPNTALDNIASVENVDGPSPAANELQANVEAQDEDASVAVSTPTLSQG